MPAGEECVCVEGYSGSGPGWEGGLLQGSRRLPAPSLVGCWEFHSPWGGTECQFYLCKACWTRELDIQGFEWNIQGRCGERTPRMEASQEGRVDTLRRVEGWAGLRLRAGK